jgi:hypothetical protein
LWFPQVLFCFIHYQYNISILNIELTEYLFLFLHWCYHMVCHGCLCICFGLIVKESFEFFVAFFWWFVVYFTHLSKKRSCQKNISRAVSNFHFLIYPYEFDQLLKKRMVMPFSPFHISWRLLNVKKQTIYNINNVSNTTLSVYNTISFVRREHTIYWPVLKKKILILIRVFRLVYYP